MNLMKIDKEIDDFRDRVINTFKMKSFSQGMFDKYRTLTKWILAQSERLKKKDDPKGLMNSKFLMGMMQKIYKPQ